MRRVSHKQGFGVVMQMKGEQTRRGRVTGVGNQIVEKKLKTIISMDADSSDRHQTAAVWCSRFQVRSWGGWGEATKSQRQWKRGIWSPFRQAADGKLEILRDAPPSEFISWAIHCARRWYVLELCPKNNNHGRRFAIWLCCVVESQYLNVRVHTMLAEFALLILHVLSSQMRSLEIERRRMSLDQPYIGIARHTRWIPRSSFVWIPQPLCESAHWKHVLTARQNTQGAKLLETN